MTNRIPFVFPDRPTQIFGPSLSDDRFRQSEVTSLRLNDETATALFAKHLASRVSLAILQTPRPLRIYLSGNLGAGKTTLVRLLLRALGISGRIKSPTYALLEPYEIQLNNDSRLNLYHFDFYRMTSDAEWGEAGFRELFEEHALTLAEWPEKVLHALPIPDLWLVLEALDNDARNLLVYTFGEARQWEKSWLSEAHPDPQGGAS